MNLETRCQQCGKPNRLVGIEPHHKFVNLDVRTYECIACGNLDVVSQLAPAEMAAANNNSGDSRALN